MTTATPRRRAAAKPKAGNAPDMTNAPEPQDHKTPAEKEGTGAETVIVDFHGTKFTFPLDQDDWPILAVQAMSRNMHIDGLMHLLGPAQWQLFTTLYPTRRQFNEFSMTVAEALGFETLGN